MLRLIPLHDGRKIAGRARSSRRSSRRDAGAVAVTLALALALLNAASGRVRSRRSACVAEAVFWMEERQPLIADERMTGACRSGIRSTTCAM